MPIDISNNQLNSVGANTMINSGIVLDSIALQMDPGIVASYPGTGTNWYDLSGTGTAANGNKTGTLVNGVAYSSVGGGTLSFDGSDDQVLFNQGTNTYDPILLSGAWTANFWIKTSTNGGLFSHWSGGPVNLALAITSGKMNFYYYDGQWNSGEATTGTTVTTNNWMFLSWVRPVSNTGQVIFYVNAVQDYLLSPRISWGSYNMGNLGAWWSFNFFNGLMGLVTVYNRVLTPSEILQNYNATRTRYKV